jgi:hypothetical protein
MKWLNEPVAAISVLCLLIILFGGHNKVLGQGTSQTAPKTQQEQIPVTPQAAAAPNGSDASVPQYSLTIAKAGNGQGKVWSNPQGSVFKKGAVVTVHAAPDSNTVFDGWSGNCSGSNRTCSVTMTGDKAVTASFLLKTYTIQVRPPVNGVIHPFGAVKVSHGEKRRFQIIPLPGYRVSEVLVDKASVGTVNAYTFTNVTGDHNIEAIFIKE